MDIGALLRSSTGMISGPARFLGFASAAYTGFVGAQQIAEGEYVRGGLNIATGTGAAMGIASGISGTASWLGPVGWVISGGATLGGVTYDYLDQTQIAPVEI